MVYDVLIIGAGCVGSMTASLLSRRKCKVAVAEAACDVAMGATCANSAIVHAGYDALPGTQKAKFNVRGNILMKKLCRQLDVEIRECGSHVIGFDEADRKKLEELYERGVKNGVPDLRIIDGDELRKMEPNVSKEAKCSLYAPSAAITCPYGITIAAAENAAVNGVDFHFNFKVDRCTEKDGIYTVYAGEKEISAKYVLNCAGVHSAELAAILGEKDFPITITPRRGEYYILDKICGNMANSTLFVCPSERGKGILVSPTVHGNLIVGPNAHEIDDPEDKSVTAAGLAEIAEGAKRIMPSINLRNAITTFAGVRPTPNTYDFYIKPSEQLHGVIHAVGVESPGFAASPAIAEYLVELLGGEGFCPEEDDEYIPTRRKDGNHKQFNRMTPEEKNEACRKDPSYGKIVCRCETVTEGDLIDAIRAPIPAVTVDMLKKRLRAGMGRCQGGFCSPRVAVLIAEETSCTLDKVTKSGGGSWLVTKRNTDGE